MNTAKAFNDRPTSTGVVLTKLDGDAWAGPRSASAAWWTSRFIVHRHGEKLEALDEFHPTAWPAAFWAWATW